MADPSTESNTEPAPSAEPAEGAQAAPDTEAPAVGKRPGGRGRIGWGLRDMVISMVVLVVVVLGLTALSQNFTFSPGGPSTSGSTAPTVDAAEQYQVAVGQVHFPLREPKLPAGWHANSANLDQVTGSATSGQTPNELEVGWITPAGRYVAIAESSADAADLARQEAGLPDGTQMVDKGQVKVGSREWAVYSGTRTEQSWVLDLGSVRLLVTGNGSQAEFTTMAEAAQSAPVLPVAGD
ncbi:MAG TPA: DUF4245 domain-containing protein [Pseudonocardiaceae bacterium]|nr:DUF4245 domain-containing protein [Pseudonocardiaceae bacterium]